jgi:hypothetical protein
MSRSFPPDEIGIQRPNNEESVLVWFCEEPGIIITSITEIDEVFVLRI